MKNQTGNSLVVMLALALGIACMQSASAQTFKKVNVAGNAPLAQVSAGGASVWALASNGKPYILKGGSFALANAISLSQIAVGGGNTRQADTVWALDSSGKIYHASKSGTTWVFPPVPGVLSFIAVGAGYQDNCHPYEVWGLNPSAQIFRYDFCTKSFGQLPGTLGSLSVGGGNIWGINGSGTIFRFNFATLTFDQIPPGLLAQLTVGPNGVWGINPSSQAFEFHGNTQTFDQLPGSLTQIQAGGNGVWGLNSGQIFRLEPSTAAFVRIPGVLVSISVGSGGGVWGINSAKQVFAFTTP